MELARRAHAKILYDKKDISQDIAPFLKSFSYTDVMSGEADDISITMEDRQEIWKADWLPEKGAILTVSLICQTWQGEGEEELPLGQFEIDEIEYSSPPNEVKIKGVSVPNNTQLRGVDKNRSWEKTKLSVIANDIAAGAAMKLFYDTNDDPKLDRAEQTEQSDLGFLQKLCKDAGLALKISDMQIVIFDEEKYERQEPIMKIENKKSRVKSYGLKSSIREIYTACHVKYKESKKKATIEYTYTLPNKKGKTLQVNEQVETIGEAEKLAKKKLREKNKEEITASVTHIGNIQLVASATVELCGFGNFDGRFIITRAVHEIGSGYTTKIDIRRCLDGY